MTLSQLIALLLVCIFACFMEASIVLSNEDNSLIEKYIGYLESSKFETVDKHFDGIDINGDIIKGRYYLRFINGTVFWSYEDMVWKGTYSLDNKGNISSILVLQREVNGELNYATGIVQWNGLPYRPQK